MASGGNINVSSDGVTLQQNLEEFKPRRDYDKFGSFINFNELDSKMKKGTLHGLNRYITNNFKTSNSKKKLIIGVAGNTGAGKSSLINALQGLTPQNKGAAPVGIIETTKDVKTYPYKGNARTVLMDFPGVGSANFPKEKYLAETKLLNSNVVIIVSSGRFTENDLWMAKEAIEMQRKVLFVRTKIDVDLYDSEHDYPGTFNEDSCLRKIRENMEQNIKEKNMDLQIFRDEIYLVSSRHKAYDFDKLVSTLKCLLNNACYAICQLLYEHMQKTIKSKTSHTEKEFLGIKIASAITGLLQIPMLESALDEYHVGEMIEECKKIYCIDENSLEKLAKVLTTSKDALKAMLKSYSKDTMMEGKRLHSVTEDKTWGSFEKYAKYLLPVVGSLFSAYKSPYTIQECLETICRGMADDELMLVRLRLEKLRKDFLNA